MLIRYWLWTSSSAPATSGLPFGPLRYRAWTSGTAIIVPAPVDHGGNGPPMLRITVPDYLRLLQLDDEELLWLVVTSAATDILQ
jgi:hypothetical protein